MRDSIKLVLLLLLLAACDEATAPYNQALPVTDIDVQRPSQEHWPESFGWGKNASTQDIAAKDIDVRPDGKGLPDGKGTVAAGRNIYTAKCESCHGNKDRNGVYARLFPHAIPDSSKGQKLIGNYWPYATTLYDYINRAMPFNEPGSLSHEEVYSITAYVLYMNKLWPEEKVMQRNNLATVVMPALSRFVPDDRKGGAEIK